MSSISFIVPTFNRARFLSEALSAILPQMREGDELLVIDDGSTDETRDVIAAAGPKVRYLYQANAGKAVALNRALAATSCPWVWICDDDDILRPGAVASLAAAMADGRAGFAFGGYTRFSDDDARGKIDLGTGYWPDLTNGSLARHILEDAFVMQNAALVRREAYERVGPFSEAMPRSLDYEMFVRLAISQPAVYVDQLMFDQRKHDGARGPAAMLHAAARSDQVWQQYDRLIFLNLYKHASIEFFESMFTCADPQRLRRAALLCRSAIMARHNCYDEAINDIEAAAEIDIGPLSIGERAICRRALSGKHGFADLRDSRAFKRLMPIARAGGVRSAIVREMVAGTLWRIRRGESDERAYSFRIARRLLGMRGLAAAYIAKRNRLAPAGPLRERDVIETDAMVTPGCVPAVGLAPYKVGA